MRDLLTTLLDLLALLVVAVGIGGVVYRLTGWVEFGILASGVVVGLGSWYAHWQERP